LLFVAGLAALTVAMFAATTLLVRWYRGREAKLGQQWFARGEAALESGDAPDAVRYLRSAVHYSHDLRPVRLRLAEALAAAGSEQEAEAYLRTLWEDEPDNGIVNLELARLRVRSNDVTGALRYFHGAIYGLWTLEPDIRRRQARFELIDFLLQRGEKNQADAELVGLAAELPPNAALHARVGALFLEVGNSGRALAEFKSALTLDRRSPEGLAGAGEASFRLRQYWAARRYLEQALRRQPSTALQRRLQIVKLIVGLDPYIEGVDEVERADRVRRALQIAGARLQSCAESKHVDLRNAPQSGELVGYNEQWQQLDAEARKPGFAQEPELQSQALTLAGSIEESTAKTCGPPQGQDLALLLLQQQHENAPQ
jgi:tetratricopeptide (TPR) repeat protein